MKNIMNEILHRGNLVIDREVKSSCDMVICLREEPQQTAHSSPVRLLSKSLFLISIIVFYTTACC